MIELRASIVTLTDQIKALRSDLAGTRPRNKRGPKPADLRLLEVIPEVVGELAFNAIELLEHNAALKSPRLAAALTAAGGTDPQRLGHILKRLNGVEHAGFRPQRIGKDRDGAIWQILRLSKVTRTRVDHCANGRQPL